MTDSPGIIYTDEPPHARAKRIAEAARDHAKSLGAQHVIVFVGDDKDGSHHASWSGTGMTIRGLFEVCADIIRRTFVSPHTIASSGYGGFSHGAGTGGSVGDRPGAGGSAGNAGNAG